MSRNSNVSDCEAASRGQLLLIFGLLLATVFVALAVVVNSGIYTQNLASRENTNPDAIQIEQAAIDEGVLETLDRANANAETNNYGTLLDEYESMLDSYNTSIKRDAGANGRYLNVRKLDDKQGVRLRQTNSSRNMTSKEGAWNWSVADETLDESGHFTMNLQEGSMEEMAMDTTLSAMADSAFGVEFNLSESNYSGSGDGVWRVYFFEGAGTDNIYAIVERPNQTFKDNQSGAIGDGYLSQACAMQGDSVSVWIQESYYGGLYCDEFEFYNRSIGEHTIRFVNARSESDPTGGLLDNPTDRARGTYDIMLGTYEVNVSAFHDVGDGEPWHQAAIYRVDYDLRYRSTDTTYTVDTREVWPTKDDPGGIIRQHPDIDRFVVTDETAALGTPGFEVDWSVSDVDRDLKRVELHLIHNPSDSTSQTEQIADETQISVDNGSASGTNTLSDTAGVGVAGEDYRIQITAVDDSGRATSESVVRTATDS